MGIEANASKPKHRRNSQESNPTLSATPIFSWHRYGFRLALGQDAEHKEHESASVNIRQS